MTRLGIRLALAGGRGAVALTAVGVALGTAVLLLALTIDPAINTRAARLAWREPMAFADTSGVTQTRFNILPDGYRDRTITRVVVAGTAPDAPVPPGIPRLPAAGESYLSPALARLAASEPAGQLADRFGTLAGEIGPAALADPGELVAITGVAPEALPTALGVTSFDAPGDIPTPLGFLRIGLAIGVVGLLAPVAIFVATATRLSAARRAERLATVRLSGATPAQARRLAAVEAILAGGIGGALGVVLFFALRPIAALLPFNGHAWFVDDLAPNPVLAALVVLAVPLVSMGAAMFALRDALAAPLGTARHASVPPLSPMRLLPLVAAFALLAGTVSFEAGNRGALGDLTLYAVGAAFLVLVASLVWAGPYLVGASAGLLRRVARRPATLIAARRLTADARGGFYAISGVVLAVFVGSVFHALIVPLTSSVDTVSPTGLRRTTVSTLGVDIFQVDGERLERVRDELEAVEGVHRVVVDRSVDLFGDPSSLTASVMSCADATAVLDLAADDCGTADLISTLPFPAGSYDAISAGQESGASGQHTVTIEEVALLDPPQGVFSLALLDPSVFPENGDGLAPTRILVATDGSDAAIERARTTILRHSPATIALPASGEAALGTATVDELTWLINFGLASVMLVAGSTLALSVIAGLIQRRRPLGLLRMSGMPMSQLRRMVFIEAAGPLVGTAVVTALAGIGVAQLIARLGLARDPGLPGLSIFIPVGIGVVGGLLVVLAILPFLERATATDATRFE